jgi:hypothetical protein
MQTQHAITLNNTISLVSIFNVFQGPMHAFSWILIILFILSCTSEKQAERDRNASVSGVTGTMQSNASGASEPYALEITPKTASRDSMVNLILTGFVVEDAKIEWLLNGTPVESSLPNQIKLSQARRGNTLQARAYIHDREILSNTVDIVNAPPMITSVRMLTEVIKPGDALGVAVEGSDVDDDNVTFLYEWTINNSPAGTDKKIGRPTKRGDSVIVKVIPFDGENYGTAVVLNREIQNQPPIIQEHGEFQFNGTLYTYPVKAADPDGDVLTYTIESPAEGMTIDNSSGLLTWEVPAEYKGKKNVSVVVADGHGGTARYVLDMNIQ